MNTRLRFIIGLNGICQLAVLMSLADAAEKHSGQSALNFARDVLPILSDHSFSCHGPDEASRQAGLPLDRRDDALKRINGTAAIVPGEPASSEVIRRIRAADVEVVMPPPDALKPLSKAQKDVLERWIAVGAPYAGHWAFTAPRRSDLPEVRNANWPRNEIDRFILQRVESAGLTPSDEATGSSRELFADFNGTIRTL